MILSERHAVNTMVSTCEIPDPPVVTKTSHNTARHANATHSQYSIHSIHRWSQFELGF